MHARIEVYAKLRNAGEGYLAGKGGEVNRVCMEVYSQYAHVKNLANGDGSIHVNHNNNNTRNLRILMQTMGAVGKGVRIRGDWEQEARVVSRESCV